MGSVGRALGLEHHVLQANQRYQCRGLGQHQPIVGEAGQGEADHLRQQHSPKDLHACHPIGRTGFGLPSGDGHESTAERFRKIGTEDEAHRADPCDERVDIDVARMTEQRRDTIDQVLAAVEDQQDQYQVRYAADDRGVAFAKHGQPLQGRQAACRAQQAEGDRHCHGNQGQTQRQPSPLENGRAVAVEHGRASYLP